jgi:hypothetical protein
MSCSTATQASRCGDVLWLGLPAHTASALAVLLRYGGNRWPSGWKGDTVCVNAMHCVAPSVRVAVNAEIHDVGASETRRFSLR